MSNYHFNLPYGSLLNYIPKETYEQAVRSRDVTDKVKSGNEKYIGQIIDQIAKREQAALIVDFLTPDSLLIPVPRSSLIKPESVWPSKIIAEEMIKRGYGSNIKCAIERKIPIRKSSSQAPEDRPTVKEHLDTLQVVLSAELTDPKTIILVDDVVTEGRVAVACAYLLKQVYPDHEIKLFAISKTNGFKPDVEIGVFDPYVHTIIYYKSGKTFRG